MAAKDATSEKEFQQSTEAPRNVPHFTAEELYQLKPGDQLQWRDMVFICVKLQPGLFIPLANPQHPEVLNASEKDDEAKANEHPNKFALDVEMTGEAPPSQFKDQLDDIQEMIEKLKLCATELTKPAKHKHEVVHRSCTHCGGQVPPHYFNVAMPAQELQSSSLHVRVADIEKHLKVLQEKFSDYLFCNPHKPFVKPSEQGGVSRDSVQPGDSSSDSDDDSSLNTGNPNRGILH